MILTNALGQDYDGLALAKSSARIRTLITDERLGALPMRLFLCPPSMVGFFRALRRAVLVGGCSNLFKPITHRLEPLCDGHQTNNEDTTMSNLSILSKEIRIVDGLYSLNDLHKASGLNPNHKPSNWIRSQQAIDLIGLLKSEQLTPIITKQGLGTFVCRELVYAFAMWISPKFHLTVIRAFDKLSNPTISDQDKYRFINAMIQKMDLSGNPVLVPYIDLIELVDSTRCFQKAIEGLQKASAYIDRDIKNLKYKTGKNFLEKSEID